MKAHILTYLRTLICFLLVLFVHTFSSGISFADDGAMYSGDPHFSMLPRGPQLKVLAVAINVKPGSDSESMEVVYRIENTAAYDVTSMITFDIPEYEAWGGAGNWYPDRSYSELTLYVNNVEVIYGRVAKAYYDGKDVTDILKKYDLYPNDIGDIDRWTVDMDPETEKKYPELKSMGIMEPYTFPKWAAVNVYSYPMTLKAKEIIEIKYRYNLLPGVEYFRKDDTYGERILSMVKLTWERMQKAYGGVNQNKEYYSFSWVELPLWLNEWGGSDPKVTITIMPRQAQDLSSYMSFLNVNGKIYSSKEKLVVALPWFVQKDTIPLVLLRPMPW